MPGSDCRQHVVEQNAYRTGDQKSQHDRKSGFLFLAQLRRIDQSQWQWKGNIDDKADEAHPQPRPEKLAHQETELHSQAAIEGVQEKIESLGMKFLGDVEQ